MRSESETNLAGHLLGASLTLIALLLPILIGLFTAYEVELSWTKKAGNLVILIWVLFVAMIMSAVVASLSLAHLWWAKIPAKVPAAIMMVLIVSVVIGSFFWIILVLN